MIRCLWHLTWSEARFDLIRHLKGAHKLPEPTLFRWCGSCQVTVPIKISSHICFRAGFYSISEEYIASQDFQHQCLMCRLSFPTANGLTSHARKHRATDKYVQANASTLKESIKLKKSLPTELTDNLNLPLPSATSPSSSPRTCSPSSPAQSLASTIPISEQPITDSFPDDPVNLNSQNVTAQTRIISHPDDPPPSINYTEKFKEMLDSEIIPP